MVCAARLHLGLRRQAHVAYFVEEDGAAVGLLKLADALLDCRGESPFLVAEEFAFDEFGRDGGAVHLHEGRIGAVALLVQQVRHHLLARAVRAGDEHPRFGGCHAVDELTHAFDGGRAAYHLVFVGYLLFQRFGLHHQVAFVEGVAHRDEQAVEVDGLLDEVERPFLEGFHGGLDGAVSRYHDDGGFHAPCQERVEQLHAVHAGHLDVREDEVEAFPAHGFEGLRPVLGQRHGVLLELEDVLHRAADASLVVYD